MPNWVYSNLAVTGPADDVQRLKDQVGKSYIMKNAPVWNAGTMTYKDVEQSDVFSFWNIVSPPEDKLHLYHAKHDGSEDKTWGWYNWNCEHWGTKWDCSDVSIDVHGPDDVRYTFSTAWSPPVAAMIALSEQFPEVALSLEWEEEQGYGGTLEFSGGTYWITDEYDTPSTHAEMVERKEYCYCDGGDEPYFSDCPNAEPEVPEEMYVSDNELDVEVVA